MKKIIFVGILLFAPFAHALEIADPMSGRYVFKNVSFRYSGKMLGGLLMTWPKSGTVTLDVFADGTFKGTSDFKCKFNGRFNSESSSTINSYSQFYYTDAVAAVSDCDGDQLPGETVSVGLSTNNLQVKSPQPYLKLSNANNFSFPNYGTWAASAVAVSGLWWNANESGWGLSLTQQGATIVAAWFTFDDNGKPTWYVASCSISINECSGDLYKSNGGSSPVITWNGTGVTKVGTLKLAFTDNAKGTMTYTINGVSGTKTITPQPF